MRRSADVQHGVYNRVRSRVQHWPWTSMTVRAPRVIRAPLLNLPRTSSTISSIWPLHFNRYCYSQKHKLHVQYGWWSAYYNLVQMSVLTTLPLCYIVLITYIIQAFKFYYFASFWSTLSPIRMHLRLLATTVVFKLRPSAKWSGGATGLYKCSIVKLYSLTHYAHDFLAFYPLMHKSCGVRPVLSNKPAMR